MLAVSEVRFVDSPTGPATTIEDRKMLYQLALLLLLFSLQPGSLHEIDSKSSAMSLYSGDWGKESLPLMKRSFSNIHIVLGQTSCYGKIRVS